MVELVMVVVREWFRRRISRPTINNKDELIIIERMNFKHKVVIINNVMYVCMYVCRYILVIDEIL